MVTKPTAFVLGAGVSMPYGFPSGSRLVKEICGATGIPFEDDQPGLLTKGEITKVFHNAFGERKTEEFGKALNLSQKYSIDAFLERRPEFIDIGKWAIALFILRQEISANLFSFDTQDNGCYRYLFEKIDSDWESYPDNKIAFITFNYDRSLEQFLFTKIQNTYGKNERECADVLRRFPIIHVHGSLGKLPFQDKNGISYGADIDRYKEKSSVANGAASHAAKQIKVIAENQTTSEEFEQANRLLTDAERIYFLGFGYHQDNILRLGLDKLAEDEQRRTASQLVISRLKGTGLGLEEKELVSIRKWHIHIPDASIDNLLFLKRHVDLD